MRREIAGLDWSGDRMIPAFQAPGHLAIYDLRGATRDTLLTATTMTGLINRPRPEVYLITSNDDAFWLSQAFGFVPQERASVSGDEALNGLLTTYGDTIQGGIIYDPDLVDTINIATMLAGQRDGIVVSPEQAANLQLPVLLDLRTYGWKNRLQVYRWRWRICAQARLIVWWRGLMPGMWLACARSWSPRAPLSTGSTRVHICPTSSRIGSLSIR